MTSSGFKKNDSGFSLISVLVAMSIMGITVAVVISLLIFQSREITSGQRQLVSSSLKYQMLSTLSNGHCGCQEFIGKEFIGNPIHSITIGNFYATCAVPADQEEWQEWKSGVSSLGTINTGTTLITSGDFVGGSGNNLGGFKVNTISIQNTKLTKAEPDGETKYYKGDLIVTYEDDPNSLSRLPGNISIPILLRADNTNTIKDCWGDHEYACFISDVGGNRGNTILACGWPERRQASGRKGRADDLKEVKRVTAIGHEAGWASGADLETDDIQDNVYIGFRAGKDYKGQNSILIGSSVIPADIDSDSQFMVGNTKRPDPDRLFWLTSQIGTTVKGYDDLDVPDFRVNGEQVVFASEIERFQELLEEEIQLSHEDHKIRPHFDPPPLPRSRQITVYACNCEGADVDPMPCPLGSYKASEAELPPYPDYPSLPWGGSGPLLCGGNSPPPGDPGPDPDPPGGGPGPDPDPDPDPGCEANCGEWTHWFCSGNNTKTKKRACNALGEGCSEIETIPCPHGCRFARCLPPPEPEPEEPCICWWGNAYWTECGKDEPTTGIRQLKRKQTCSPSSSTCRNKVEILDTEACTTTTPTPPSTPPPKKPTPTPPSTPPTPVCLPGQIISNGKCHGTPTCPNGQVWKNGSCQAPVSSQPGAGGTPGGNTGSPGGTTCSCSTMASYVIDGCPSDKPHGKTFSTDIIEGSDGSIKKKCCNKSSCL